MTNTNWRKPSRNVAPHASRRQVIALAATAHCRVPVTAYCLAKSAQCGFRHGYTVATIIPSVGEILERLLATADVFLINQPSLESLERRSLDPEYLLARLPRLICCSITGYRLSGPHSGQPGYV